MGRGTRLAGWLLVAAAGAGVARGVLRAVSASAFAAPLERTNHRGHTVSLAAGPALAVGAAAGAAAGAGSPALAASVLLAGLPAGAVGLYDDVVGARPEQRTAKGFRGHLGALREGRVTSGLVKIAGIGAASLVAAAVLEGERGTVRPGRSAGGRLVDTVLSAGVIAGGANLANLFDLRPGRALKVGLLAGLPLLAGPAGGVAAGAVGAAGALLPDDLGERVMLGDGGANALGALLGVAAARSTSRLPRVLLLAGIAGLTLASEKVSFTKVIEATPVLRELDAFGRRPPTPVPADPS
jgi:UDP-N-acetylmuramyl pentapeptide phosphotransferase/UDP-N-acetylglucosamine-1-phosphate transferase